MKRQTYSYEALDCKGTTQSGTIEALSESNAISILRSNGLYPTSVRTSSHRPHPLNLPMTKPAPVVIPFSAILHGVALIVSFIAGYLLSKL